jgi:hypothetical protein
MEYTYHILPEHQLIIETVSGELTLEGLAQKTKELFADPQYDPRFNGVIDLRRASSHMTQVEVYGFAGYINESGMFGQSKWAIVGMDHIVIALSRIFKQRMPDQNTIGVYSTIEAAAKFVDNAEVLNRLNDDSL